MIRHAALLMALFTLVMAACTWWARATNSGLAPWFVILTACGLFLVCLFIRITPGDSDE